MITEILTECRWQNAIFLERDPNPFPDDNWNDKYFDHDPGGKEARV
jgi:hypothetical protein